MRITKNTISTAFENAALPAICVIVPINIPPAFKFLNLNALYIYEIQLHTVR
jgi:hypothetical protein